MRGEWIAMPKTVMIDGFNLALDKGTGVSTYARNLSNEVHSLGYRTDVLFGQEIYSGADEMMREISFFDIAFRANAGRFGVLGRTILVARDVLFGSRMRPIPQTGKVIRKQFESRMPYSDRIWNARSIFSSSQVWFGLTNRLKTIDAPHGPDLMHWTYPFPLRVRGARNIYTLHDLVPLRLPYTSLDFKRYYLKLMRELVRTADHIVTVSETSRRDIIDLLDCPEDKVTNTYQAVHLPEKLTQVPEAEVRKVVEGTFGLPYKEYFLFFGALEPKKNLGRLVEAYLGANVPGPLAIVGSNAWEASTRGRLGDKHIGLTMADHRQVRRFDYASFANLVSLIRGAKAVTFPSLYEGFGLPILEAMLLGTPVITSAEGSTAEVAGDAALLVDPYDPGDIARAIREIDADPALRERLSAQGREQARKFSRERYRQAIGELYERVLA